jgi:uncharacterized protein YwqG
LIIVMPVNFLLKQAQTKLLNDLAQIGLGAFAAAIARGAKAAAYFRPVPRKDADIPIGASKLGGAPDLPANFAWPRRCSMERKYQHGIPWRDQEIVDQRPGEDIELSFIAQLDLSSIQVGWIDVDLPRHGLLSFFYEAQHQPWGFDPIHRGGWQLFWIDATADELVRSVQQDPELSFPSAELEPQLFLTVAESLPRTLPLTDEQAFALIDFIGSRVPPGVQVGGHPMLIQNAMEEECEIVSRGYYAGNPQGYQEARSAGIEAITQDWRLVLQVSSIEMANMMWGDGGNLYAWMRGSDMQERRFENAWTILQCT